MNLLDASTAATLQHRIPQITSVQQKFLNIPKRHLSPTSLGRKVTAKDYKHT